MNAKDSHGKGKTCNSKAVRECSPKERPASFVDEAGLFSQLYCLYAWPFLRRIYGQNIDFDVFSECSSGDNCEGLSGALERNWNHQLKLQESGKEPNFTRAFYETFKKEFILGSIPSALIYGVGKLIAPIFLGKIIHYSNKFAEEQYNKTNNVASEELPESSSRSQVILWSSLLTLIITINFLLSHPYFTYRFRNGMQMRAAVTHLLYKKVLKTSLRSISDAGNGRISNMLSKDASRFEIFPRYCSFLVLAWAEMAGALYILYHYNKLASGACLAMLIVYVPFQCYMANVLSKFRSKSVALTDDRLKLMTEILPAMRVIKMYVWEKPFASLVHLARKLEMNKIRQAMILRSINLSLYFAFPKLMAFVFIIIYLNSGEAMNAEVVFVTLAIVFQIREIAAFLPQSISHGVEAYYSSKRVQEFLLEDEIEGIEESNKQRGESPKIALKDVTVLADDKTTILQNVSLEVEPGKLTVVIGPVGSGKSSILMSILKEMPIRSGSIKTHGKVIYVSQEAWIFSGTVRENILFGKPFDSDKYRKVVRVSALVKDIAGFEDGDLEKVDDRGTSLSGGQKARISLARALYADADCYLLDDPLSAVDASVAKHIFEKCIKQHLSNKCVILVTHQLQFIKSAHQIIILKDGSIIGNGSYDDLVAQGFNVHKYSAQRESEESTLDEKPIDDHQEQRSRAGTKLSEIELMLEDQEQNVFKNVEESQYSSGKKLSRLQLYWIYCRAGGGVLLFTLFFTTNILSQALLTGSDYWLSLWTEYKEEVIINNGSTSGLKLPILLSPDDSDNILIYSLLILLLFVTSLLRMVSFFMGICTSASINLHFSIFSSLIQAPMIFFDKTPIGVIMNRISRDLGIIDDEIPSNAFEAMDILMNSLGIFIICALANQYVLIPFVFLIVMVHFTNKFYVESARRMKKLEAVARSPIFNQMSSTIGGLSTIRSFHAQNMLLGDFSDALDFHSSILYMFYSCGRFYGIILEVLCLIYLYSLIFILNYFLEEYSGSVIGLTISQCLMLTNAFNWGIRQYIEVETQMTSVERVVEFGNLEKENLEGCELVPDKNWPNTGELIFENVSLEYSYLDNQTGQPEIRKVLKNISFTINNGEKIGIIGRTGAGKTSIITALFRLTQPTGSIKIDSIDTAKISLTNLRNNLSIIPQEPILFSGSVRRNLDPFGAKSDEAIWSALSKVQLSDKIRELPKALDTEVGNDFSVGQKQLICLARAILRNNRILVLDEATANVDPRTDSLIQSTIRSEFAACTVLTIAHRLNTVIDYDRILVLDQGKISQFDTPYALIKKESGIFYELFTNLSPETKRDLKRQAFEAEERRLLDKKTE